VPSGPRALPGEVLDLLGDAPERITRFGPAEVLRGRGLVAKVGPTAARNALVLGSHLPLSRPALVAAGPDWVVMEEVADHGGDWDEAQVFDLVGDLAVLHSAEVGALVGSELDEPLVAWWRRVSAYGNLDVGLPRSFLAVLAEPRTVFDVLADARPRLVHTDPYRRNIRRPAPGERVWIDWDDALLGPPALDLAAWMLDGHWFLGRTIDPEEVLESYQRHEVDGTPAITSAELDAALVLVTVTQDLPSLRDERGEAALARFVDERQNALVRLGLSR
jgi:hypothetical protein